MSDKKKVKLWKWPSSNDCDGCYFDDDDDCTAPPVAEVGCIAHIYKEERPVPEFIEVEI